MDLKQGTALFSGTGFLSALSFLVCKAASAQRQKETWLQDAFLSATLTKDLAWPSSFGSVKSREEPSSVHPREFSKPFIFGTDWAIHAISLGMEVTTEADHLKGESVSLLELGVETILNIPEPC